MERKYVSLWLWCVPLSLSRAATQAAAEAASKANKNESCLLAAGDRVLHPSLGSLTQRTGIVWDSLRGLERRHLASAQRCAQSSASICRSYCKKFRLLQEWAWEEIPVVVLQEGGVFIGIKEQLQQGFPRKHTSSSQYSAPVDESAFSNADTIAPVNLLYFVGHL